MAFQGPPPNASSYSVAPPRMSNVSQQLPHRPPSAHYLVPPPPGTFGPVPPGVMAGPPPPGPAFARPPDPYTQSVAGPPVGPRKRLIVACDGTWLDSDNGMTNGQRQPPSNVSRLGWAMKDTSREGIPQVVHYQAGVGSTGGTVSEVIGGATGAGLQANVREAYSFLAVNWRDGDEIFLVGFSRGAWTARSVGGMIAALGLLTRAGLPYFAEIYEDFEHRYWPNYTPRWPDLPFPDKPPFDDPRYLAELEGRGLTRRRVPIKAIAVFDTVGSLGIPRVSWLERLGLQSANMKHYSFYDTSLNECIENAFQALALDEHRSPFMPALWEKPKNSRTNLTQCWFPGVHSNVGGGYDDQGMANITLAWMISRLEPFIDFRLDYILKLHEDNKQYYRQTGQRTRPWSFGEIYNSLMGFYTLAGSKTRTPGNYFRSDPITGRPTKKRLKNTNEFIHASVRSRVGLDGPGPKDRNVYTCKALSEWTFSAEATAGGVGEPAIVWKDRSGRSKNGRQTVIPEAVLMETERRLLGMSPKVEDYVMDMRPAKRRSKRAERTARNAET